MSDYAATPSKRFLVVEDDPGDFALVQALLKLVFRALKTEPLRLFWSKTLAAGIDVARRERPDVVLLNLSLPDSTGLATVLASTAGYGRPVIERAVQASARSIRFTGATGRKIEGMKVIVVRQRLRSSKPQGVS